MDPADIGKHPDLIRKAQADISQCDVLVCGRCHSVFHLIELFREHKENEPDCKRSSASTLHNCDEAQAKVWAFLLWKSAQRQQAGEEKNAGANNSWKLYQTWVKLEESVRDTWIVAGKTIQSFSKTGAGSLQEMPVKITKTILEPQNEAQDKANAQNRFTPTVRKVGGDVKPTTTPVVDTKNRIVVGAQTGVVKKTEGTPVKTPVASTGAAAGAATTGTPTTVRRSFATRTHPKTGACSEEEVEKILAKRFSPIIKMHEYLVKWAKMTNDQNTWEPLTHLHSCQSILEHFEVQLAKQKEQRAATAARALQMQRQEKGATGTATTTGTAGPGTATTTTTTAGSGASSVANQLRPIRTSKASALDRVKQWTAGNRSPGDSADDSTPGQAGKRKLDDGESDAANDADGVDSAKKLRTDSTSAVNDALTKVSQTGNVKIVSVSASGGGGGGGAASGIVKSTMNGTVAAHAKDGSSAEVVIIKSPKDGIASGISKRSPGQQLVVSGGGGSTGAITTRLSPRSVGEAAKVKIVPKSEVSGGSGGGGVHGIFKVKSEPTGSSPQGASPKAVVTTVTAGSTTPHHPPSRPITITTGASTTDSSGVTTRIIRRNIDGTEQLVKQTIRKTPKLVPFSPGQQQQQRPGGIAASKPGVYTSAPVPKITTSAAVSGQQRTSVPPRVISTSQQKPTVSRVVTSVSSTPGTVVRTSTVTRAVSGPASSEQKINALRRQGVNVVKRVITSSTVVGGKKAGGNEEEETEAMTDGFSSNVAIPAPPSPPRAMTLCPVTGKVLSQAEGEPTPVPSPEAEPEDKKEVKESVTTTTTAASSSEQATTEGEQMVVATGGDQTDTQVQQLLTNEDGSPILVAGEDGTVYQVAGKNAEGQTILIAQGSDGEQSCVLVASQEGEEDGTGGAGGVLTLDAAVSEAVAVPQEGQEMTEEQAAQYQQSVDTNQELTISTEDSQDAQITAEVVQADQPSPGGTRRVVLLLPDGSFMMTEVNDEQYQSLNLVN